MTPAQIGLVQDTFRYIVPVADLAAELFYKRLFELDPKLEPLFTGDMGEQGGKFMRTLATLVAGLEDFEAVAPSLRALGRRHADYGAEPAHYETLATALLWTLEQAMGEVFTDVVKEAWTAADRTLAATMIDAARLEPVEPAGARFDGARPSGIDTRPGST